MRKYTPWAGLDLETTDAHRVKKCRKCGAEIVLLQSAKSGKWYPVNFKGVCDVMKNDFHKC